MFGIGGSEIIVILVVALLFLGPDKLPDAAKTISKGIRDLKKQSRALQTQIESDEQIGGAIRDLKSALRGDEFPTRPPVRREPPKVEPPGPADVPAALPTATALTLPASAGEPDPAPTDDEPNSVAELIKPAPGTVAKGEPITDRAEPSAAPGGPTGTTESKQTHG